LDCLGNESLCGYGHPITQELPSEDVTWTVIQSRNQ
jgi:hypothetical protein